MSSASPIARQVTQSKAIPSKRIVINSPNQLPNDYSTTPGGTIYSTTPGGTRIVYERNFLMQLRNSPLAMTPPKHMHFIPGVSPTKSSLACDNNNLAKSSPPNGDSNRNSEGKEGVDEQFQMEL